MKRRGTISWIAAQPYYKVKRVVSSVEQKAIVEDRLMHLYQERIVTKYREFPISEVFDLSYRSIGGAGGLLYLHTLQGVYSYTVAADPQPFIEAYKELVQSSPGK